MRSFDKQTLISMEASGRFTVLAVTRVGEGSHFLAVRLLGTGDLRVYRAGNLSAGSDLDERWQGGIGDEVKMMRELSLAVEIERKELRKAKEQDGLCFETCCLPNNQK